MPRSTKRRQIFKPRDVEQKHYDQMMSYVPDGYELEMSRRFEIWRDFYFTDGSKHLMLSLPLIDD